MSEKLNLSDLGLEPDITPAEKAAKGNSEPIMILPNQNENKVQTIKSSYKPTETNNDNPNVLVTPHGVVNNTNNIAKLHIVDNTFGCPKTVIRITIGNNINFKYIKLKS